MRPYVVSGKRLVPQSQVVDADVVRITERGELVLSTFLLGLERAFAPGEWATVRAIEESERGLY